MPRSKILCSSEVSPKTRQRIIQKAREMNYLNIDEKNGPALLQANKGSISFLTRTIANDSEFWGNVLEGIEMILSAQNFNLPIVTVDIPKNYSSLHYDTDEEFRNFGLVTEKLKKISSLPDVFICGNDWTAIQIMYALQFPGYKIPKDISIVGFDNIPASERLLRFNCRSPRHTHL